MKLNSTRRHLVYGGNLAVSLLVLFGILVAVNYLANLYPKRLDLTEFKENSLAEQTIKILSNLEQVIEIRCFYKEDDPEMTQLKNLLELYRYYSSKIEFEFIDPDKFPSKAEKFGVRTYQTIIVSQADRQERPSFATEEKLTNAILRVTKEKDKRIYFLKGHGERDIDNTEQMGFSEAKQAIINDDYQVSVLTLVDYDEVPNDCDVLVIAGPFSEFFEEEVRMIHDYASQGGRLLLLLDPGPVDMNLSEFVINWGVYIENNKIIDPYSRMRGTEYFVPIVEDYDRNHPITKDFNIYTIFPLVRSLTIQEFRNQGITIHSLAKTTEDSWGETHPDSAEYNETDDHKGPLNVAIAIEQARVIPRDAVTDTTLANGRMVIVGDSNFADNVYFYQQGNSDFFMNCLAWLAGEEDLISIRSKEIHERRLNLTNTQARMLFWIALIFIPFSILFAGSIVWWVRR